MGRGEVVTRADREERRTTGTTIWGSSGRRGRPTSEGWVRRTIHEGQFWVQVTAGFGQKLVQARVQGTVRQGGPNSWGVMAPRNPRGWPAFNGLGQPKSSRTKQLEFDFRTDLEPLRKGKQVPRLRRGLMSSAGSENKTLKQGSSILSFMQRKLIELLL